MSEKFPVCSHCDSCYARKAQLYIIMPNLVHYSTKICKVKLLFFYSSVLKSVVRKPSIKCSSLIMRGTCSSAIKPTSSLQKVTTDQDRLDSKIRLFSKKEVCIQYDNVLGCGVFGKCFFGYVGPVEACFKVSKGKAFDNYFFREANILLGCCHCNVSYLLGVCLEGSCKILVLSYHGANRQSYNLHSVLISRRKSEIPSIEWDWKSILFGIINGLCYIHAKNILHNDIKEDNVVLHANKAIIVDFGKACLAKDGKKYFLSNEEKKKYMDFHPHISPDLRDGRCIQSKSTDVYSFGRLLFIVSEKAIATPFLISLSKQCMEYNSMDRPITTDLFTSLSNYLTI